LGEWMRLTPQGSPGAEGALELVEGLFDALEAEAGGAEEAEHAGARHRR
jgi:hypothetical protein